MEHENVHCYSSMGNCDSAEGLDGAEQDSSPRAGSNSVWLRPEDLPRQALPALQILTLNKHFTKYRKVHCYHICPNYPESHNINHTINNQSILVA